LSKEKNLINFQTRDESHQLFFQLILGVADFMGYPGMTTLICPQDPSEPARLGYHANKYVSIWDNGNRESVTVDSYMVIENNI
jgi:hypothetical protein